MNVVEAKRILGIENIKEARRCFLEKARQLHPDKGGDTEKFKELQSAYEYIRENEVDDGPLEGEDWGEWLDWMGRWAKRVIHATDSPQILKIKIPWEILTNRREILKIDYDGIPIVVPLHRTETFTVGGIHIQLIPKGVIQYEEEESKASVEEAIDNPWFKESTWLFNVPNKTEKFKIDGGEWSNTPGHYGNGVYWIKSGEEI
jgi:hypothetical protein